MDCFHYFRGTYKENPVQSIHIHKISVPDYLVLGLKKLHFVGSMGLTLDLISNFAYTRGWFDISRNLDMKSVLKTVWGNLSKIGRH